MRAAWWHNSLAGLLVGAGDVGTRHEAAGQAGIRRVRPPKRNSERWTFFTVLMRPARIECLSAR